MKAKKGERSCWGCHADWKSRWKAGDLMRLEVYGQKEWVCPDCFEEMPEDALADV